MLGALTQIPDEQRAAVNAAADKIRAVVSEAGDMGLFALGIVGIEAQIEAEKSIQTGAKV